MTRVMDCRGHEQLGRRIEDARSVATQCVRAGFARLGSRLSDGTAKKNFDADGTALRRDGDHASAVWNRRFGGLESRFEVWNHA